MRISLNGEPREVRATSLADALAEFGLTGTGIATAVNGDFVPATARPSTRLAEGDRIEVVTPQRGG